MVPGSPFKMAQGRVDGDHPLSGMWVVLTQRNEPADGECNLYAVAERQIVHQIPIPLFHEPEIIGYANVRNSN